MEEKKLTDEVVVAKNAITDEEIAKAILQQIEYNAGIPYIDEWLKVKTIKFTDILNFIQRLKKENEELKSPKFASWKLKFFNLKEEFDKELAEHEEFTKEAKAEIERLTEENEYLDGCAKQFLADYQNAQVQVDELTEERENMQAEIMRFEDIKFTQEHCDLYSENETLKQWLKRLNAENEVFQKQVDELKEERENMQAVIFGLEEDKRLLQNQVDELKQENSVLSVTIELQEEIEKQALKDATKEILDDLRNIFIEQSSYGSDANQHIGYYDYEVKIGLVIEQIEEYAKEKYGIEYGVEVE